MCPRASDTARERPNVSAREIECVRERATLRETDRMCARERSSVSESERHCARQTEWHWSDRSSKESVATLGPPQKAWGQGQATQQKSLWGNTDLWTVIITKKASKRS
ncbi:hypothetical protein DPX16_23668 [Anabarilius grahami]|uniref:Uncharacterized protein n=1 Tax=Anabarilius grahami TaxID=495550 RepID=A0A3N0XYL1_ANAGA|nr:hypothetical protein DPX16_23668 [Anabarilius grahami]